MKAIPYASAGTKHVAITGLLQVPYGYFFFFLIEAKSIKKGCTVNLVVIALLINQQNTAGKPSELSLIHIYVLWRYNMKSSVNE